jgi:hypothetical protein
MKELIIYEFQAKHIEDSLRLVIRTFECKKSESSMDRDVLQAMKMIENVIAENPNQHVNR